MAWDREDASGLRGAVRRLTTPHTRSRAKSAVSALHVLLPLPAPFRCANREGQSQYDVFLPGRVRGEGVSAMLRVRNEEAKIWGCLDSILGVFDEIVLVDNASTDATGALVRRFKTERDHRDTIRLHTYPFEIARLGRENAGTPEDSVHSVAYFYNWCMSQCRLPYVCKWDADMFLVQEAREDLRSFLRDLSVWRHDLGILVIQTAYRDRRGRWFLAKDEFNSEPMAWPNRASIRFHKTDLYEALRRPSYARLRVWPPVHPPGHIYELKDTGEDEFSHWSPEDRRAFTTERKRREWRNFQSVRRGDISPKRFVELDPALLPGPPGGDRHRGLEPDRYRVTDPGDSPSGPGR